MNRFLVPALVMAAMAQSAFAADQVNAKKLKGAWARESNGAKIVFQFKDEKKMRVVLTPPDANVTIEVEADYTLDKDGVLAGVITETKGGDGGPAKGDKFGFKIELGKDSITVSDLTGDHSNEEVKKVVEGVYKKKND